jgi:hypothetical protein
MPKCDCSQHPKLIQTGWSVNHEEPDKKCPVCAKGWWTRSNGTVSNERPPYYPKPMVAKPVTIF